MLKVFKHWKFSLAFVIILVVVGAAVTNDIMEANRRQVEGCKPTGDQKFRMNGDKMVVQDKLLCRDGHFEWADAR